MMVSNSVYFVLILTEARDPAFTTTPTHVSGTKMPSKYNIFADIVRD